MENTFRRNYASIGVHLKLKRIQRVQPKKNSRLPPRSAAAEIPRSPVRHQLHVGEDGVVVRREDAAARRQRGHLGRLPRREGRHLLTGGGVRGRRPQLTPAAAAGRAGRRHHLCRHADPQRAQERLPLCKLVRGEQPVDVACSHPRAVKETLFAPRARRAARRRAAVGAGAAFGPPLAPRARPQPLARLLLLRVLYGGRAALQPACPRRGVCVKRTSGWGVEPRCNKGDRGAAPSAAPGGSLLGSSRPISANLDRSTAPPRAGLSCGPREGPRTRHGRASQARCPPRRETIAPHVSRGPRPTSANPR